MAVGEEPTNYHTTNKNAGVVAVLTYVKHSNASLDIIKSKATEYNNQLVKTETVKFLLFYFFLSNFSFLNKK